MRRKLAIGMVGILCIMLFSGCQSRPAAKDTIFTDKIVWNDSENLYEVPLEVLDGVSQAELYGFGNDLLLTYTQFDQEQQKNLYNLKLVSIETGETLYEKKLNALLYGKVQILQDGIAIHDLGQGKSYIMDDKLQLVGEYDLAGGTYCVNASGDTGYLFTYKEGIWAKDLATGEQQIFSNNVWDAFLQEATSKTGIFTCVARETLMRRIGMLDLETGEMIFVASPYFYAALESSGETWLGKVDGEDSLYVLGDVDEQKQFYTNPSAAVNLNGDSGQLIISEIMEDGALMLSAYDASGNLVSQCEAEGLTSTTVCDFAWYEEYNGYVFTMTDETGADHLMFWDVSEDMEGDDLLLESVSVLESASAGTAIGQEYYDRAKLLSEKYDVEILIADQCDTEFTDHSAELLTSETEVQLALDTLDHVLGSYPEGFFTQLKHNAYYEIEIQLLGTLKKTTSEGDISYISGGFVTTAYTGKLLMALDARAGFSGEEINSILAQNTYHEFSHIIDKRLAFDSQFREDAVYTDDGWLGLNPEGFEYNDSYYGTLDGRYADYFVDAYACSNATEDRARTMEYAMAGEVSTFASKGGLTNKLEYYCQGIRDSFDTTGWPEETPWEKTLNEVK